MTITSGATPRARVHVLMGADWARSAGTDFWLIGGVNEESSATGAGLRTLDGGGWTATSITERGGSTADFLSAADQDNACFDLDAQNDVVQSPTMFGGYAHGLLVQKFLGYAPTELNAEVFAKFVDATNNETNSGFGFVEGGGSILTANDAMAVIHSDGTNYKLRSGAATSGAGAVDDTGWHLWRIRVDSGGCQFWIDGAMQLGTELALQTDEWPAAFGIGVGGAANFIRVAWAHVWYT